MSNGSRFPEAIAACAAGTMPLSALRGIAADVGIDRVVLVEGVSDRAVLETLAARQGRRLAEEGIAIISMGGAMSIRRFARVLGPEGIGLRLGGLCDVGEEAVFSRGLEAAGVGSVLTRERLDQLGFGVCDRDLEDELIRALGVRRIEEIIADEGDLAALVTFRNQPFQRTQPVERQLHRFFGTMAGRKERYARALAAHLDLAAIPSPIARVLDSAQHLPGAVDRDFR
jgi:hypothetical protein